MAQDIERRGYDPARVVALLLRTCTRRGLRPAVDLDEPHAGRAVRAAAALLRAIGVVPLYPDGTEYPEETSS
jgi:hypothetical protein